MNKTSVKHYKTFVLQHCWTVLYDLAKRIKLVLKHLLWSRAAAQLPTVTVFKLTCRILTYCACVRETNVLRGGHWPNERKIVDKTS